MDLQFLFPEPVLNQIELSPGYDDHASNVWLVTTSKEEVVVRSSRLSNPLDVNFWWGCRKLFGIDPRKVHGLERINQALKEISSIPVPAVIRKGEKDKQQFAVVEKLRGDVCHTFIDRRSSLMTSLGDGLGSIHTRKHNYFGNPAGAARSPLSEFHPKLIEVMIGLVKKFYPEHAKIQETLPQMIALLKDLPDPNDCTLILIDIDANQFLTNGEVLTGLFDTEAYAIGPRAFDFIGLEYILNEQSAKDFKIAYKKHLPIPYLEQLRLPYRFFYRLIEVQGDVDLDRWLNYPELF